MHIIRLYLLSSVPGERRDARMASLHPDLWTDCLLPQLQLRWLRGSATIPTRMSPSRHFLAIPDFSQAELLAVFDLAARMKRGDYRDRPLAGKTLGMIFAKSSTRTRVSFEVGAFQLGGHALFLSSRHLQLGRG